MRTLILLAMAVLTACAADTVRLEVVPAKTTYPLGAQVVATVRFVNTGTAPATITAGWTNLPAEFVRDVTVDDGGSDAQGAIRLMRFGPPTPASTLPKQQSIFLQPISLVIPAGSRFQWLVPVTVPLDQEGAMSIPWCMPLLLAECGGVTTALPTSGSLAVVGLTPASCMTAAGVTASATAAAQQLFLHLTVEPGRQTRPLYLERAAYLTLTDAAGAVRADVLEPGGMFAMPEGSTVMAELSLPLVNPYLKGGLTVPPGSSLLGWRWRQWLPTTAGSTTSATLAFFESYAGPHPSVHASLPNDWSWPYRDDAGTYPERGDWLAADIDVVATLDAQGTVTGRPSLTLNRPAKR